MLAGSQQRRGCGVCASGPSPDLFVLPLLNINLILKIGFSALYRCSGSVGVTFMSELLF